MLYQIVPQFSYLSLFHYFSHTRLSWRLWSWVTIPTSSFSTSWTSAEDWTRTSFCQGKALLGRLPFHLSSISQGPETPVLNWLLLYSSQIPVDGSCLILLSCSYYRLGIPCPHLKREFSDRRKVLGRLLRSGLGVVLFFWPLASRLLCYPTSVGIAPNKVLPASEQTVEK